jgi:hypothetical protein
MKPTTLADLLDRTIARHERRSKELALKVHGPDMRNDGWKWTPVQAAAQLERAFTVQQRAHQEARECEAAK